MISRIFSRRAARLVHDYGELPPGSYHREDKAFTGISLGQESRSGLEAGSEVPDGGISISYEALPDGTLRRIIHRHEP